MPGLSDVLEGDIDIDLVPSLDDLKDSLVPKIDQFGVSVVKGIENAYGYIRSRMVGKEDEIVQAFTVGTLSILAGIYMYNRAKGGNL